MKITIIGNSVALRVRPPEPNPENKNYSYLLREHFGSKALIENKAIGATTISNWLENIDHSVNSFPDLYIINIGVVDATIREVPLWFYRLANKKSDDLISKIIRGMYRGPISRVRPFLAKIRGTRSWISGKRFRKNYEQLISTLLKETNAQIITLPINTANDRIEKQLPGSRKNHEKFNQIIRDITEKYQQSILNLSDLVSETHYPDGVHFNAYGHQVVTERVTKVISEKME